MHQLRSYELRHFLILLDYANDRRDPTYLPARKREEIRLILGFGGGDKDRERLEARLRRFHELELIELYDDGSILMAYLVDQQDDDDDADFLPGSVFTAMSQNGSGQNGSGQNGTGPSHGYAPERRQPGERRRKPLSSEPSAVRKREYRQRRAEAGDGPRAEQENNETWGKENNETWGKENNETWGKENNETWDKENNETWDNLRDNVPSDESNCPRPAPQLSPILSHSGNGSLSQPLSQNGRDMSGTSLAGVSPNVNVSGEEDYKIISDSGDVSNVAANPMSQTVPSPNVPQTVPPPAVRKMPAASSPLTARAAVRPGFEEVDTRAQMMQDVGRAIGLARDSKSRGFYIKVWKHCSDQNSLACWDMALEILEGRIAFETKSGPPPGQPGHFPPSAYGKSLNKTLMNLLRDNGTPFEEGTAEERDEARQQIAGSLAAGSEVIPPLGSINPGTENE